MLINVYTDGSCDNSKGIGSYGYIIMAKHRGQNHLKRFSSPKYVDTTNNRMELKSIIKALESIQAGHSIDVYSDSKYCVDGINQWLDGWIKKGVLHTKLNVDLWERFLEIREIHRIGGTVINVTWVRGHNGNEFNEMADDLAGVGRLNIQDTGINCKKQN